jgi:glycosyltransferase involved in cell wall biosynthesis
MIKPANITYLIGSLDRGGAEGQVTELLRRLDRTRFQPRLILFEPGARERVAGLVEDVFSLDVPQEPANAFWRRSYRALKVFMRLCGHLRRNRPDILHAHLPASCILGLPAGRLCGIPVLIGSRRSLTSAYREADWIYSASDRLIIHCCHFMVGNADAVSRELVEIDGLAIDKVGTIHNGVDTVRFRPERSDFWRAHYGWKDDEVVFGMVANFFGYKRHVDFVEAAVVLHRRFPLARFVMVGQDRGELPVVRAAIAGSGLSDFIQVAPSTSRPEDLYAAMDVLVSCSDSEGFSNVILEAMASGKPVIATSAGGNTEAVVEGSTGFLVPCRSPWALVKAAERLLEDRALRELMGRNGRQRAEEHFSVLKMVRAHEQLYARLLEQRCSRVAFRSETHLMERESTTASVETFDSLEVDARTVRASARNAEPF